MLTNDGSAKSLARPRLPKETLEQLRRVYEREYKELCDDWQSLERKAQSVGAVAGAVVAATSAVSVGTATIDSDVLRYLLMPLVLFLFGAGFASLKALHVVSVTSVPPGEKLRRRARRLHCEAPSASAATYETELEHLEVGFWDQACTDLHRANQAKADWVKRGQLLLLGALGIAVLVVMLSSLVSLGVWP